MVVGTIVDKRSKFMLCDGVFVAIPLIPVNFGSASGVSVVCTADSSFVAVKITLWLLPLLILHVLQCTWHFGRFHC